MLINENTLSTLDGNCFLKYHISARLRPVLKTNFGFYGAAKIRNYEVKSEAYCRGRRNLAEIQHAKGVLTALDLGVDVVFGSIDFHLHTRGLNKACFDKSA